MWPRRFERLAKMRFAETDSATRVLNGSPLLKEIRMDWYSNLKMGTKQVLGYSAILALTAFLGLVARYGITAVRADAVDMAERRFP